MKNSLLFTVVLFLFALTGYAQDLTLDEVLSKHFKAIGQDKLSATKTLKFTGVQTVQGMELPFTIYIKRPNKVRVEMSVQGSSLVQAFNGKEGWTINPFIGSSEPQDLTGAQIEQMKNQANIDGKLYRWRENGLKAELLGVENVDSVKAYKIKITEVADEGEEAKVIYYFIDANNFLLKKAATKRKVQGQMVDFETYMGDYRNVEGIYFPFVQDTKMFDNSVSKVTFDKVLLNVDIDDVIFERPVK